MPFTHLGVRNVLGKKSQNKRTIYYFLERKNILFKDNKIGGSGLKEMVESLKSNETLTELNINSIIQTRFK